MIFPNSLPREYYGDDIRWFVATVVNATPPPGFEGRVRVRIYGVHNQYTGDISESDLPWAQVLIPNTEGGISGLGRIPQLTAGAFVFGMFLDGKSSQLPLIVGSFPRIELPTEVQRRDGQKEFSFNTEQEKQQNVVNIKIDDDYRRQGHGTEMLNVYETLTKYTYNIKQIHLAAWENISTPNSVKQFYISNGYVKDNILPIHFDDTIDFFEINQIF